MQIQVTQEPALGVPRLEHYPEGGGAMVKTVLERFPCSVGRTETADLFLDSSRASREHALIESDGETYRVRDLGSTNGTFLNGQRIDEGSLHDGDVVLFADLEFSFFTGRVQAVSGAATQPINFPKGGGRGENRPVDVIRQVRRLHEMLTRRSITNLFQPVADLEATRLLGYEARGDDTERGGGQAKAEEALLAVECRLTGRIHQVRRMLAAEEAIGLPAQSHIFLRVHSSEIGDDQLIESLARLQNTMTSIHRLIVEVPESAVSNTPYFETFHDRLHEIGAGVAYDDFAAGPAQLAGQQEIRPDYVKLASTLVRGIYRNAERQRHVRSIANICREIGCQVIAGGVDNEEDAEMCRDLGCRFGQGGFCGPPRPLHLLLESSHTN
jgi:EAL domain-containing protein (putative c-di-GMP-specific phosphodiesterase class I)